MFSADFKKYNYIKKLTIEEKYEHLPKKGSKLPLYTVFFRYLDQWFPNFSKAVHSKLVIKTFCAH